MPSRCICGDGYDPECKRHGTERRAKMREHKQRIRTDFGPEIAEAVRIYRARTGANLRANRGRGPRPEAERLHPLTEHKLERLAERPEGWKAQAACRPGTGVDPSIFFVERGDSRGARKAKAVCARCPVWQECANYAVAANEKHGIWGGMGEHERRRWAREQREAITA